MTSDPLAPRTLWAERSDMTGRSMAWAEAQQLGSLLCEEARIVTYQAHRWWVEETVLLSDVEYTVTVTLVTTFRPGGRRIWSDDPWSET